MCWRKTSRLGLRWGSLKRTEAEAQLGARLRAHKMSQAKHSPSVPKADSSSAANAGRPSRTCFMCNGCERVRYCDADCQLKHWPVHKLQCDVCLRCETVLTNIHALLALRQGQGLRLHCSKAHWSEHKKDCMAPSKMTLKSKLGLQQWEWLLACIAESDSDWGRTFLDLHAWREETVVVFFSCQDVQMAERYVSLLQA
jgi:hypothetical protein